MLSSDPRADGIGKAEGHVLETESYAVERHPKAQRYCG